MFRHIYNILVVYKCIVKYLNENNIYRTISCIIVDTINCITGWY